MDIVNFVQNIKFYCERKGVKPTVACRESGVGGSFINNIESRGSIPSVEKVEQLAHYLGTTVSELIGEAESSGEMAQLHDSAVVIQPDDFRRLSLNEMDMVLAYRCATPKERRTIDGILEEYKNTTSGS